MRTPVRFTLLELLVVISIIVILSAILFPSLRTARMRGGTIACANNMKQLGLATLSYTGDYNDWMPLTIQTASWNSTIGYYPFWLSLIHPYLNGKDFDGGGPKTSTVVYCSSGKNEIYKTTKILTNYMYSPYFGRYNNTWGYPTYNQYGPRRISSCLQPSVFGILIDGKDASLSNVVYDFTTRSSAINYVDLRHAGGTNTLFVDGHITTKNILLYSDNEIATTYGWYAKWKTL